MRTTTLLSLALVILTGAVFCWARPPQPPAAIPPSVEPDVPSSPHADALALLFKQESKAIAQLEKGSPWHDTTERQWSVQRPFQPGIIDSTHLFTVTYKIGTQKMATWSVDSRRGTVKRTKNTPAPEPKSD